MDRITKSLLEDFLKSQGLETSDESDDFEKFCNYTIVSANYNKTFSLESVSAGAGGDTGIDGIAIIVNGHLVEDAYEVEDLLETNGYLDVTYIFTQAKTSSGFETKDMRTFYHGVVDFFSEKPKLARNEEIEKFSEISETILKNAPSFKENPKCKIFYITTGQLKEDKNISAVMQSAEEDLQAYNIFESINCQILGATEIGKLYRKTKNPISSTFTFLNKVTHAEIEGVEQSFYGILPFSEFKKLLVDENGNVLSVFEDNVRDFQGLNNPVNQSIKETLVSANINLFSVLNNGITVVADSLKTSGNTFTISDYQIVNGCQTSNVLYESRDIPEIDNVDVPLRLIVTNNEEIKSKITISTNNQTAIKKEQLTVMSDFQKNLEHYYSTLTGDGKLYYERRAKQYNSDSDVVKRRIITVANQIKSFSSMFNKNPHLVTTYFGSLVNKIHEPDSSIFKSDHQYSAYYLAGLTYYRLDYLFNSGYIDKKYKKVKFYITMLVPMIASEGDFPPLNSHNKVDAFCDPIINKLNDDKKCKQIFSKAVQIIDKSGAAVDNKEALKSKLMTEQILQTYSGEKV